VIPVKKPYEEIIAENHVWLYRYICRLLGKCGGAAEDMLQETLLKCFTAYGGYVEQGSIKSWLACVARNTVYSYRRKCMHFDIVSFDADVNLHPVCPDESPEDAVINKLALREIYNALANISEAQRRVFFCRQFDGLSVAETSRKLGIPQGTVKSATYYSIKKIRDAFGITVPDKNERGISMSCKEIYPLLFMYAKNTISDEDKANVEAHIKHCAECASIASSLKKLVPHMSFEPEYGERMHYLIEFMVNGGRELILFFGSGVDMSDKYEMLNQKLADNNGRVPEGENWFNSGYDQRFDQLGEFDNDGNKLEYETFISGSKRVNIRAMKKVYPYQWFHEVVITANNDNYPYEKNPNYPDAYMGTLRNGFGCDVHSSIYLAIPKSAESIRIVSGTGVIDCGDYKFAYTSAYVTEAEDISLVCGFIKK
jgi:RNA polymerase sigma factor, sigma-70 family